MVVASQAHLFDATTWGWIHRLLGLLVAFAGWGLLGGIEGRLPTLASLSGNPSGCPRTTPVDGVDASAFLLGHSPTTGRDHVIPVTSEGRVAA